MSKSSTDVNNTSVVDDYVSPTSDFLLGEFPQFKPAEETSQSFTYIAVGISTPPYTQIEDRFETSACRTRFSPDFGNIRRFVAYIIGQTPASLQEQQRVYKALRNVPVTIHPEVVREAEEETLTDDLETSIELAQDTYSTLKRIEISIEYDPEILDRKTIRFGLTVSGNPETILQNEALFKQRLRSSINRRTRELITVTYGWENK